MDKRIIMLPSTKLKIQNLVQCPIIKYYGTQGLEMKNPWPWLPMVTRAKIHIFHQL